MKRTKWTLPSEEENLAEKQDIMSKKKKKKTRNQAGKGSMRVAAIPGVSKRHGSTDS